MTKKKKIIIGVVIGVVAGWVVLGSLSRFGAAAVMRNSGGLGRGYNAGVVVKDFEPLELVFVTTTTKRGAGVNARDLLLKEAQKLGGHGIINVNIDTQRKGWFGDVTVTASALAIKYTDSAGALAADTGIASLMQGWPGFGRTHW